MAEKMIVKELDQVVVRFSGDSGDGMQLAGNLFSTISATVGNDISTFPDYPADIRAPQGSLTGVSGFQVHIGAGKVFTPGDQCDVLVAMNAAALKTQYKFAKSTACIIIDTDCFQKSDLEKAAFKTDNPIEEMGIKNDVIAAPISQMVKDCLADSGMDNKSMLKCRNMFGFDFPGLKIVQFAFDSYDEGNLYNPDNFETNCVAYLGSHDNEPLYAYLKTNLNAKENIKRYYKQDDDLDKVLINSLFNSKADLVILQMQDVLKDDRRMNTPGSSDNNWGYRMPKDYQSKIDDKYFVNLIKQSNR